MVLLNRFYYRKEWLAALQELQKKWNGELNQSGGPYSSLTVNIRSRKIYLSATMLSTAAYADILIYGNWKTELVLALEDIHDKFLKLIGLEYEITLPGNAANIILFNRKYLIKGEPKELIIGLLSDKKNEDIVISFGDFAGLYIKDNLAKLVYELSDQIMAPEALAEKVNHLIDFLQALEQKESAPTK